MKKYIIGFVLGAILFSSGVVFAKAIVESNWFVVQRLNVKFNSNRSYFYEKTFDEDTNVVCYATENGISCLKNN